MNNIVECEECGMVTPVSCETGSITCPGCGSLVKVCKRSSAYRDRYAEIGLRIGKLVDAKNHAYGDSFSKSGAVLEILYPSGVKPSQYGDLLAVARVLDKLFRVAKDKDAMGESPWMDIAGYGILGVGDSNDA